MNEDYEYLMDNHIRNLQRITNGKSAHENYIDFLNQRRETVDRINRLNQAKINEKAVLVNQNCNDFPQKDQAIRFCQGVRPLLNE